VIRTYLASVVVATATLVAGVTSAGAVAGGTATYTGTVQIHNSNTGNSVSMPLSITIQGHRITGYEFFASLRCTDGSLSNVGVNYAQQTSSPIPFTGRHFAVTVGLPSTGIGLTARITGTVAAGRYVTGHIRVEAHADSGVAPSGPLCTAAYHWVARAQSPVAPPTTAPSTTAPSVELTLVAVREPLTASAYEYGIAVSNVACADGAVAFTVAAGGHSATLTCTNTVPHPLTNAFFGLDAGSSYQVTVQPLVRTASGLVEKGAALHREVAIPSPGSPTWHPIPGA
jgi:hypothetical protein